MARKYFMILFSTLFGLCRTVFGADCVTVHALDFFT